MICGWAFFMDASMDRAGQSVELLGPISGYPRKISRFHDHLSTNRFGQMSTRLQRFVLAALSLVAVAAHGSTLIERKSKTHWAFQPIRNPELPTVADASWPQTPLDQFVLAKLESEGLTPSAPAGRRTLLRRAYVTLTGLQPSYQQTQAFISDRSPDAFAKVVDQLLASPQYGERWARHWLDVARYADTKGYVFQEARQYPYAYTFRDWVIRALNEDLPYDQFLKYQIAADKLAIEAHEKKHLAAMGFLTVGRRFLNRQPDIIDDRIDVVTRGTMALTVACSRCHDHKYDPIPTADYYSLYGVFASSQEPEDLPLLGAQPDTPETKKFERELAAKQAKIDSYLNRRLEDQRDEKQLKKYLIALRDGHGKSDAELKKLASSRQLVQGVLLRWRNWLSDSANDPHNPVFAPWHACFRLDPAKFAAEAPVKLAPILSHETLNPRVRLALQNKELNSFDEVAAAYAKLFAHDNHPHPHDKPAREQIRLTLRGPGAPTDIPPDKLYGLLPTPDQNQVRKLRRAVEAHKTNSPGAPPRGMVMTDRARPTEPYIFVRGQQGNRGPKVPRQFPAIAAGPDRKPFPATSSGRLEMANLIASENNPLTARVIVNRVWLQHFGRALVDTPSDFGLRSDPPSHPELLDFLAHRFMEEGWSLKKLHRHLLLSKAFQQSSAHDPNNAAKDPENRLLWRMNRQRLDFESMRDSLVQVTGKLDQQMFGRPYKISKRPFSLRRTVYGEVERQNLESVFRTFDFASPDAHCPQRHETTVPQQALFMMNSPFVEHLAATIAESPALRSQGATPETNIRHLYRRIFGRDPDAEEIRIGEKFLSPLDPVVKASSRWQYGYGKILGRGVSFTELPSFVDNRYQGGDSLPDPTTGWASLHKTGGHPGHEPHFRAILRFTAPEAGIYVVETDVRVPAQMSDGIVVTAVANPKTPLAQKYIPAQKLSHFSVEVELAAGQALDLIVGGGRTINHDSFNWDPKITNKRTRASWRQSESFAAPRTRAPAIQQYAQALLSTNEFAFID